MISTSTKARALAFAFVCSLAASAHAAPPSATDLATARELYRSGMAALDANQAKEAADKLAAAWQLAPTPLIGVALAHAQAKLGNLVEAREAVLAVRRLEVVANETSHSKAARADADALDLELARRIPHLHVVVKGAPSDAMVSIDGSSAPLASLAVDRPVNPGAHELQLVWGNGTHARASITIGEGERKDVELDAPPETPPPIPQTTPPVHVEVKPAEPPPKIVSVEPAPKKSPLVPIGAIVGGVGIAAGLVFGGIALNDAGIVHSHCDNTTGACPPQYEGALHDAQGFAAASTVGFVVAGVGAVVMIVGFVIDASHRKSTSHVSALGRSLVVSF